MNKTSGKVNLDIPLWIMLLRTAQNVETRMEAALANSGLSLPKLAVLKQLVEAGEPLPLSRLAEKLACVKSNITQLIDRLESDGLVERTYGSTDRRTVFAKITEEGLRKYRTGSQSLAASEKEIFKEMNREDQERLKRYANG